MSEVTKYKAQKYLQWYYTLPKINKLIGILDKYNNGKITYINFVTIDCIEVFVEYTNYTKIYRAT